MDLRKIALRIASDYDSFAKEFNAYSDRLHELTQEKSPELAGPDAGHAVPDEFRFEENPEESEDPVLFYVNNSEVYSGSSEEDAMDTALNTVKEMVEFWESV